MTDEKPLSRTALITGATSGIGAAVAAALVSDGYRVLGTGRDPSAVTNKIAGVHYLVLDLGDAASIEACAVAAGAVDVLVNNAGESQSGPLEDLPIDALRRLFDLNVFGAVLLTQLVLPGMRERGYGRVVMVGSMMASFPIPFRSSYAASKAAIRAFATAARREVSPYGVAVTTVEPGPIKTGIGARRTDYLAEDSPYAADVATMLRVMDAGQNAGIPADQVARTILRAITAERPKPFYAVGGNAPVVFALRRMLPQTVMERLITRRYGLR
jgi:short-subunit dehydrogenase